MRGIYSVIKSLIDTQRAQCGKNILLNIYIPRFPGNIRIYLIVILL